MGIATARGQRPSRVLAEEWDSRTVGKREGLGMPWLEAVGRPTRRIAPHVIGWGCILRFLRLVLNWNWGQELGKLSVINQGLIIWGQLLPRLLFVFLDQVREMVA